MRKIKEVIYSKDDLAKYELEMRQKNSEELKLIDKVDDVLFAIMSAFDAGIDFNWWFNSAGEGEVGHPKYDDSEVYDYTLELTRRGGSRDFSLDTTEWSYKDSFPIEYLFMTRKEITDSIKCQIEKDIEAAAKRAKVNEVRSSKNKAKKQAALSKLSDEDKRVLGLE